MFDKEKVIKGLECCAAMNGDECRKCPYERECRDTDLPYGMSHLAANALALLKEQEAIEPINSYGTFRCGNCKNIVGYNDGYGRGYQNNYCSECGKAVKWR